MSTIFNRRIFLGAASAVALGLAATAASAQGVKLSLSSPASPTDQRAIALTEIFGPAVKDFASFQPHWNATLFKQGTELEAIARGPRELSIPAPQALA
ncbi:MAG: C4-dicarboxylate ABC transporter, partial [Beijerinckiaceae bacterium]|nr:C4-dicarboxylate ABC transporter [Beijerinckiaceae bacterium]